jgi:transcription initiation factor IIE alpha subunit
METIMENPLDHWVALMLGTIKAPTQRGDRRYIDGRFFVTEEDSARVILKIIKKHGSLRPQDIVEASGYKKTTVYRVLDTMTRAGQLQIIDVRDLTTKNRTHKHYTIKGKKK